MAVICNVIEQVLVMIICFFPVAAMSTLLNPELFLQNHWLPLYFFFYCKDVLSCWWNIRAVSFCMLKRAEYILFYLFFKLFIIICFFKKFMFFFCFFIASSALACLLIIRQNKMFHGEAYVCDEVKIFFKDKILLPAEGLKQ